MRPELTQATNSTISRIDSVVSEGDGVTVYRGTDLRTNQSVAIKVPHAEMEGDQAFFERFHREEETAHR